MVVWKTVVTLYEIRSQVGQFAFELLYVSTHLRLILYNICFTEFLIDVLSYTCFLYCRTFQVFTIQTKNKNLNVRQLFFVIK